MSDLRQAACALSGRRLRLVLALLGLLFAGPSFAQSAGAEGQVAMPSSAAPGGVANAADGGLAEVAVNGPAGTVLSVDGQVVGPLPLLDNLRLAPGPHRFRIERGAQRAESDVLNLPAGRQAELNLTLAGRSLVAVLSIAPAALLLLPAQLAAAQVTLRQAAVRAAKSEHVVVLAEVRQAALLREQPGLLRCIEQGDCQAALSREGEVAYVLLVGRSEGELSLRLLDVRTRDIGATLQVSCAACPLPQQAERLAGMVQKALQQIAMRARGQLSVSSLPVNALVSLDGRSLGRTPLSREAFVGTRQLTLTLPGHAVYSADIEVEAGQTTTIEPKLVAESRPGVAGASEGAGGSRGTRPLWRWLTGGALIGVGGLLLGFGAAALAVNGSCQDAAALPETCSPYYNTAGVGAGLSAGGVASLLTGGIVIALPGPKR